MGRILKQNKSIVIVLFLSLLVAISLPFVAGKTVTIPVPDFPTPTQAQKSISGIVYQGKSGVDALTLLKAKESVSQDKADLVTTIGGRTTDASKHEYWAFYVNGKLAQIGPAAYKTKNGDTIEWKIEKY